LIEQSLAIALLRHAKSTINSIRNLTQISKEKFSDKEFGEFFCRSIMKDIEKANLLLEGFLKYLIIITPTKKTNTVHRLIEEVSKKYEDQLERKGVQLSKKFEEDLPETIVPDELLGYILNFILQYGVSSVTLNGEMGFLTKSLVIQEEGDLDQGLLRKGERYIEIRMFFTGPKKQSEHFEKSSDFHKEEPLNLILRLLQVVVWRNRGIMKFETDEKKEKIIISVRFPSERRRVVYYQPTNG
jgi:hypothetical protein